MNRRSLLALFGLGAVTAVLPEPIEAPFKECAPVPCPTFEDMRVEIQATSHGGWCAPSETVYTYTFCNVDQEFAYLLMPEVATRRGGIKFPTTS